MPRFELDIPAYHTDRDYDRRFVVLHLDPMPRIGEQIAVPDGTVEVVGIRHHPVWDETGRQVVDSLPGGQFESRQVPSKVYTNWVRRPRRP